MLEVIRSQEPGSTTTERLKIIADSGHCTIQCFNVRGGHPRAQGDQSIPLCQETWLRVFLGLSSLAWVRSQPQKSWFQILQGQVGESGSKKLDHIQEERRNIFSVIAATHRDKTLPRKAFEKLNMLVLASHTSAILSREMELLLCSLLCVS